MPSRVLLQDFTGVPAVVDLAAMRDAMKRMGGDPTADQPAAARRAGHRSLGAGRRVRHAARAVAERRDRVPAQQGALRVPALGAVGVPQLRGGAARHRHRAPGEPRVPGARGLHRDEARHGQLASAYPDTLVGTDSHTTMINGLGVLGWGVGGIEAEAAMLGQPMSMLIPQVVGFRLHGALREGSTATDLVLTVTEMLRKKGVVGKFVEFFGPGVARAVAGRPRHHRQHGARVRRDLRHLPGRRRDPALPAPLGPLRRADRAGRGVLRASRGCSTRADTKEAEYSDTLELDLATVEPSVAGPEAAAGSGATCSRRARRSSRRCRRW